jgi:hypothetical protein
VTELKAAGIMPDRVRCRSSKYLNNLIEEEYRRVKQRISLMRGFKNFDTATVTISGIELAEKIKKNQFKVGKLVGRPQSAPANRRRARLALYALPLVPRAHGSEAARPRRNRPTPSAQATTSRRGDTERAPGRGRFLNL